MEDLKDFEALVSAIKESSKPITELASTLKNQLTPVQGSKLRRVDFEKVTIGNKSFMVDYSGVCDCGFSRVLLYTILNEIATSADCVVLSKGMVLEHNDVGYKLSKAVVAKDTLFVSFDAICDEVLIS